MPQLSRRGWVSGKVGVALSKRLTGEVQCKSQRTATSRVAPQRFATHSTGALRGPQPTTQLLGFLVG